MEEKILALIFNYSIKGKIADANFIYKVIEIVVDYMNLGEYVKEVEIGDGIIPYQSVLAGYNFETRKVVFALDVIDNFIAFEESKMINYLNWFELIIFRNILIVHTVLHELEHAYQYRMVELDKLRKVSGNYDKIIEMELLKLSIKNKRNETTEIYDFVPKERFAEINSWDKLIEILSLTRLMSKKIIQFCNSRSMEVQLNGYDNDANPNLRYFNFHNENIKDPIFFNLNVAKECFTNPYIRARLGLPLSFDEIRLLDSKIDGCYRKRKR